MELLTKHFPAQVGREGRSGQRDFGFPLQVLWFPSAPTSTSWDHCRKAKLNGSLSYILWRPGDLWQFIWFGT